jgi:hypothetical protein
LAEIFDYEYWRFVHHDRPEPDESPRVHRSLPDENLRAIMRDTNDILNARIRRLQSELERAPVMNDQMETDAIEAQIDEAQNLPYSL